MWKTWEAKRAAQQNLPPLVRAAKDGTSLVLQYAPHLASQGHSIWLFYEIARVPLLLLAGYT